MFRTLKNRATYNRCFFLGVISILWISLCNATPQQQAPHYTPLLVNVILNYQDLRHITLALRNPQNRLFITRQELQLWHIRLPNRPSMRYQNRDFYLLDHIPHLHYYLDLKKMELSVHASPTAFLPTQINTAPTPHQHAHRSIGAFINYHLDYTHTPQEAHTDGLMEAGFFNHCGVGTTSFLWKVPDHEAQKLVRLNSTWTTDFPETLSRLRIGDTVNAPSLWGRQLNFAGFQWQTNFATRPDFSPYPLLQVQGDALMPSVAELYINNTRTFHSNLSSGTFSINAIPHITGAGEVQLVTTDLLGKQHTIQFPFYATHTLLRPGLHQYSYGLGVVRQDFSTQSNRYHRLVAVGTDTIGITPTLTTQWHAEILGHQATVGIGAHVLHTTWGVFTGATALSYHDHRVGTLALLGFHRSSPAWNFHLQSTVTARSFTQIGLDATETAPQLQAQAFLGIPLPPHASIGLGWMYQKERDHKHDSLLTLSYSHTIAQQWHLSASGFTHLSGLKDRTIMLTLTHRIARDTGLTLTANHQNNSNYGTLDLQHNLPTNHGWGYELRTHTGDRKHHFGALRYRSSIGTFSAETEQTEDVHYLLSANGGIAFLGGRPYLTQPIGNSFALVQVPGYQGIDIYYHHKNMGHTDPQGNLLVTNLTPYTANIIQLNPAQLPLNTTVKNISLAAIPYFRSGMVLRYPLKVAHDAVFTLLQHNGTPVPPRATVTFPDKRSFPVAYNGQVYITDLKSHNTLTATWDEHHCRFTLDIPPSIQNQILPNLGIIRCKTSA